ncbi:hypothetical protein ACVOMT_03495 [Sphingomonas panni]
MSIAKSLRIEQYRVAQWLRIRGRIEAALDRLVEATSLDFKQNELLEEDKSAAFVIDVVNQSVVIAQDELALALAEAADSSYCNKYPWNEAANGQRIGQETSWDILIGRLADVHAKTDGKERRNALASLRGPVSQIRKVVQDLCHVQDVELDPEKV